MTLIRRALNLITASGHVYSFLLSEISNEPTADQHFFLDAMLVAIAELGLMPSVQAARVTLAASPEAMQGAVAAGILGVGSVAVGTSEFAGQMLAAGVAGSHAGVPPRRRASDRMLITSTPNAGVSYRREASVAHPPDFGATGMHSGAES